MAVIDISSISPRPNADGPSVDTATAPASTPRDPNASGTTTGSIATPAATQQLSTGSMLLRLLQEFETTHPGEAKVFLHTVASNLRAAAAQSEVLAPGLTAWAAKFEVAAETGELSNLFPSVRPAPHFGIHAYQVAQQTAEDPAVTEAMVGHRLPPPGSAPTTNALDALSGVLIRIATESLRSAGTPELVAYVGRRGRLARRMRRRRLRRHRGRHWRDHE